MEEFIVVSILIDHVEFDPNDEWLNHIAGPYLKVTSAIPTCICIDRQNQNGIIRVHGCKKKKYQ